MIIKLRFMSLEIKYKLLDFYCNNFTNKYKKLYLKGR